jgi:isoquinoline 1-oxidoreductase beta subunit
MNRRSFVKASLAGVGGLTLGIIAYNRLSPKRRPLGFITEWLNISPDNEITIIVVKNEMGQGISTSLPMIIAEELEADWERIKVEFRAELNGYIFPDAGYGTADSISIRSGYKPMRMVGAAAREMLIAACARIWGVEPASLTAHNSTVSHPSKGTITYGELAETARTLPLPRNPKLKHPKDFKIIGRSLKRLDAPLHVEGKCRYGIDTTVPDMMYAAVRQSPVFGGEPANFRSLSIKGTKAKAIVPIPNGVAAIANSWWDAKNALESLDVRFKNPPEMEGLNSESISQKLASDSKGPGLQAQFEGRPFSAMDAAATKLNSTFEVPFLDHAALEPLNCTAHVTADNCKIWVPTQWAASVLEAAQKITHLPASAITIYPTFLGGGFGRKYAVDFVSHAILASQAVGKPVKVIWSREEDIRHGLYRSVARGDISGGLDKNGHIVSWIAKLVAPQRGYHWFELSLAGFMKLPYSIPNIEIQFVQFNTGVPTSYFRSVNMSHNIFFVEGFIDELAQAASTDPLGFRLRHTKHNPRVTSVLSKVAEMAHWGRPSVPDAAQGLALFDYTAHDNTRTIIAHVAEVSIESSGAVKVHKIYCAVDCGFAVNPDGVKAQMEGGAVFGLTAALFGEISIKNGAVEQSNYHDYPLLGLRDTPQVETEIINSGDIPAGVGEYGVPGVIPAVTNAIFGLTGQRIRKLPIGLICQIQYFR